MPSTAFSTFNNMVALFLAEAVRSRRTSLARAAEISQRVLEQLPSIDSESKILSMLTDIEKDFGEITTLKQALHFGYKTSDMKVFEPEIREYASRVFSEDMESSARFLQDASSRGMTIEALCLKYPDFCEYLGRNSEKADLVGK